MYYYNNYRKILALHLSIRFWKKNILCGLNLYTDYFAIIVLDVYKYDKKIFVRDQISSHEGIVCKSRGEILKVHIRSVLQSQNIRTSWQVRRRMHSLSRYFDTLEVDIRTHSTLSISLHLRSSDNCSYYVPHSLLAFREVRNPFRMSFESLFRVPRLLQERMSDVVEET